VFYRRMGRELVRLGLLARLDVPALVALASSWGAFVEAEREVNQRGRVMTTANGDTRINPWESVRLRELDHFCTLLSKFGGNPADRTKIVVNDSGSAAADDLAAFLLGRVHVVDVTPAQLPGPQEDLQEWLPDGNAAELAELVELVEFAELVEKAE